MFRALFVLIAMLFALNQAVANDATTGSWVIGSYVNVRSQPSRSAEIVEHLVANTPVNLLSQQEEFCEITWGSSQHGFIACKFLGDKALRIEEVGEKPKYDQKTNSQYSPLRAFWIEPTVERLFDAGEHFRVTMLPADRLSAENGFGNVAGDGSVPELKRFPVPEFDAMKKLMANGIIAPRSQNASPTAWKEIQANIKNLDTPDEGASIDKPDRLMFKKVALPQSKSSFFKRVEEVGSPSASAEELSAQYQIPHRVIVLDKPMWGGDNNSYPILMGAWDIGKVESRLTRPVYEVAIGIDGEVSIGETDAATQRLRNEEVCDGAFELGSSKKPLLGYIKIKQPWIFFRLATFPVLTNKAKVIITKKSNEKIQTDDAVEVSKHKKFKVKIEKINSVDEIVGSTSNARIDLDGDGIDDLFVWDDGGNGIDDLGYVRNRLIFVNVAGEWYLLYGDDEHACGC